MCLFPHISAFKDVSPCSGIMGCVSALFSFLLVLCTGHFLDTSNLAERVDIGLRVPRPPFSLECTALARNVVYLILLPGEFVLNFHPINVFIHLLTHPHGLVCFIWAQLCVII